MFSKDPHKDSAIITTLAGSPFALCFGFPAWGFWAGWNLAKYNSEKKKLSQGGMYVDPLKRHFTYNAVCAESIQHEFDPTDYDGLTFDLLRTKEMYESCWGLDSPLRLGKNDKVVWKRKIINTKTKAVRYVYHFLSLNGIYVLDRVPYENERYLKEVLENYFKLSMNIEDPIKTNIQKTQLNKSNIYIRNLIWDGKDLSEWLNKPDTPRGKREVCGRITDWDEERRKAEEELNKIKSEYYYCKKIIDDGSAECYKKWEEYKLPKLSFYVLGGWEGAIAVPTCEWKNIRLYKKGVAL